MHKLSTVHLAAASLLLCGLPAAVARADTRQIIVAPDTPPIPFRPFHVEDVINPETGQPCRPGDTVRFEIDAQTTFEGPVESYLGVINDLEEKYNRLGHSLREDGDLVHKMFKDPELLNGQLLNDLKLDIHALKDKVKVALQDCQLLTLAELGVNAKTSVPFAPGDQITVEAGVTLSAKAFVARVNNQAKVLCSLGYSLLDEAGGSGGLAGTGDAVGKLKEARDSLLDKLGISHFDSKFDWQTIEDIKSFAEIASDVDKLVEARQVPSAEQLEQIRNKVNQQLPPELQIPDLPNIPAPTPPRRMDLAVKKRKDWTGLNEGDPGRFNVYATAYYEIRGTETEEEANAEGKAGAFVLGSEINALYGFGQFFAGPSEVRGKLMLRAFGQDVFAPLEFRESVAYKKSEPRLFHYGQDFGFSQQFFIGPVPVTVSAGASAEAYVGYEVALVTTRLEGSLLPGADASAFVNGGVGFGGFLSAGAEGSLTLLDLNPVLAGSAGIRFDPAGVPFLTLGLNADVALHALDGHVDLYAEYPVPRFGIPPWKTQKSTLELFNWAGMHQNYKIFNWGMDVTPFGATLKGDLVDQTDREETRHLQELIDLDQRKLELARVEKQAGEKEHAVFAAIDADLGTTANLKIPAAAATVQELQLVATRERNDYLNTLTQFAEQ